MKSILKRNRILAVIALIGLLASLVPLISRVQAEESNKYYDIVLDYNSMRSMARQSSQSEDEWLDLFKSLGVDKVALSEAIASSPFRPDIEQEFGKQYFVSMDLQKKLFCEANIPLRQQESRLTNEYQKIMATAEIPFDGKTLNLYGVQKYFEHPDRAMRAAAVRAYAKFYEDNEPRLEEIWDELIRIRNQMGKNLGYENYIPVGYLEQGRTDYGE